MGAFAVAGDKAVVDYPRLIEGDPWEQLHTIEGVYQST